MMVRTPQHTSALLRQASSSVPPSLCLAWFGCLWGCCQNCGSTLLPQNPAGAAGLLGGKRDSASCGPLTLAPALGVRRWPSNGLIHPLVWPFFSGLELGVISSRKPQVVGFVRLAVLLQPGKGRARVFSSAQLTGLLEVARFS